MDAADAWFGLGVQGLGGQGFEFMGLDFVSVPGFSVGTTSCPTGMVAQHTLKGLKSIAFPVGPRALMTYSGKTLPEEGEPFYSLSSCG